MDWVKLSARYYLDPAIASLDDAAEVMFTRVLAYAGDQETHGFIPTGMLPALCRRRRYETCAEALVARGLLRPARGGYQITRWEEWQSELEALVARRSADRDRKRRERERRSAAKDSQVNGMSRDVSRDASAPIERGETDNNPPHPPGAPPPRKRGTRLPADFTVTADMKAWFAEHCPHVNGLSEHAKFCDYWRAKPGRAGLKLDWVATWRNWMRRAAEQQHVPRGRNGRQQETDEMFGRALERARALDQEVQGDPRGNGSTRPLRPGVLPAAGDR